MAFHIVLNRPTDLVAARTGAAEGRNPRHSMAMLADRLDARVHDGSGLNPGPIDRWMARITRTRPLWWAVARNLRRAAAAGDVVFCTGEDVGVPVAAICGGRLRVAVMAHHVDRAKAKIALRAVRAKRRVALFLTVARPQAEVLRRFLALSDARVRFVRDQTDTVFFSPGPAALDKPRSVLMSVGLEQRDYTTLARATEDLDVDVRISGFSADTRILDRAFPPIMPANMTRRFYSWPDLRQLYRDADIVVVSLFPNNYAAGVQALMEGLASGRPVVAVSTEGLQDYLGQPGVRSVPPGDAAAMRAALVELLADPARRAHMAEAARAAAKGHRAELYVEVIANALQELAGPGKGR